MGTNTETHIPDHTQNLRDLGILSCNTEIPPSNPFLSGLRKFCRKGKRKIVRGRGMENARKHSLLNTA